MVTDPPYGVNYDSMWRYKIGKNTKGGSYGKSTNDDQSDWQAAYALFPGRIAYVFLDGKPRSSTGGSWAQRLRIHHTLTHYLGQGSHCVRPPVTTTGGTSRAGTPSRRVGKP